MIKKLILAKIKSIIKLSNVLKNNIFIWLIITLLLILLKIFNIINIPLIWCFCPIWLPIFAIFILIIWFIYPIYKLIKSIGKIL